MKKIVSICIPAYKQTEYLKRCIDSILMQDFTNYELIISDDTPDNTVELFLKDELKNTPHLYFKNTPSLGMPDNWNYAISKASGKYIKIMHHDDFFTRKDSLRLMVEEIEKQNAAFLFCETDVWYVKINEHRIQKISRKQFKLLKKKPEFLFFKNLIGAPSTTLCVNNKAFKYDSNFKWLVDIDFYMQFIFRSGATKIAYLPLPLISTAHNTEGQVTGEVLNDTNVQIREHVLLFNKIEHQVTNLSGFMSFFDYLFFKHNISTIEQLIEIVPQAKLNSNFFKAILSNLNKHRAWKWFKKRFFESRYNNYIFKFEQFI